MNKFLRLLVSHFTYNSKIHKASVRALLPSQFIRKMWEVTKDGKRLYRPIEIIYQVADCLISDSCVNVGIRLWNIWSIGSLKGKGLKTTLCKLCLAATVYHIMCGKKGMTYVLKTLQDQRNAPLLKCKFG
jgi:hypothetical protein